ncbi:MAG: alkaline phosphatase [Muribaculaceae bacterium]|nr:alkaline phosphatase [Muribaculaceae bacterium]
MKIRDIIAAMMLLVGFVANANQPKYVFYFIGDGMGMGHVMAAQTYNRVVLGNDQPLLMMQFPVVSWAMTYSATGPITDSAAAGTALATGHKTLNGMIGVTPDTTAVQSIASQLHDMGYGVGIITTVAPDDATPSAFYAHQPSRKMKYEIGLDAAASGFELIGGSRIYGFTKNGVDTDLMKVFNDSNITIARGLDELSAATTERVYLVNPEGITSGNVGYTIDSVPGALTLPGMTRAAIAHLQKTSPDRFFLMAEGGNIDYAGHSNDGATVVKEIINFNEAIAVAYEFYLTHPDETLIVVTADHDTGGLAIGFPLSGYSGWINNIQYQRISKDRLGDYCKTLLNSRRIYTWEDMKAELSDKLGFWSHINIPAEDEQLLQEKFDITFNQRAGKDEQTLYNDFNEFTVTVFKVMDKATGIKWTTTGHAGNPVPVFAIGVGADLFKNLNNNIEIPNKIRTITGIK